MRLSVIDWLTGWLLTLPCVLGHGSISIVVIVIRAMYNSIQRKNTFFLFPSLLMLALLSLSFIYCQPTNQPTKRANDNNNWCVHWHSILEGQQPNTNIFTGSPFIHRLHQNCYYSFVLGGGTGIVVRWANMTVLLAPRLIRPCMCVWVYLSPGHTDYWTLGRAQVGLLVIGFWFMFIPCACRALYTLT